MDIYTDYERCPQETLTKPPLVQTMALRDGLTHTCVQHLDTKTSNVLMHVAMLQNSQRKITVEIIGNNLSCHPLDGMTLMAVPACGFGEQCPLQACKLNVQASGVTQAPEQILCSYKCQCELSKCNSLLISIVNIQNDDPSQWRVCEIRIHN